MAGFRHRADSCESELCQEKSFVFTSAKGIRFHIDWRSWACRALAYAYIAPWIVLAWWLINPWSSAWMAGGAAPTRATDQMAVGNQDFLHGYFRPFSGSTECGLALTDLYLLPEKNPNGGFVPMSFCPNRERLLEALSQGGRHGFDAPYTPKGCHYRWYDVEEVCMILDRFDSIVFIGDEQMQTIFAGLNILLRRDLGLGSLKIDELGRENDGLRACRCENQFIKDSCFPHAITASDQVSAQDPSPYLCSRVPLTYLPLTHGGPLSTSTKNSLASLIPRAPPSNYRPIPIVSSLFPQHQQQKPSTTLATETLQSLISTADSTARKTPTLWIGPPAAGHLDVSARLANNDIWRFSREMDQIAADMDVERMDMWNMTVQANSWNGRKFGQRVALVQAMMVINWLSRLESS